MHSTIRTLKQLAAFFPTIIIVLTVPVGTHAQELALVTTDGGSIQIIDAATTAVIKTIQLPGVAAPYNATDVAVTPDGSKVYVTTDSPSGTFVLDPTTWSVRTTIPVAGYSVAISKDGTRAYVGAKSSPLSFCDPGVSAPIYVAIIDARTDSLVTSPTGLECVAAGEIALTPDGTRMYLVGNPLFNAQALIIYNLATNTFLTSSASIQPWGAAVTPDGTHAYLTGYVPSGTATPGIVEVDTATNSLVASVQVPTGTFIPSSTVISPDGAHAYVLALESLPSGGLVQEILVIDTASNTVTASISPRNAFGYGKLALTTGGSKLFVTQNGGSGTTGSVWAIDTATNNILATIPSGATTEPTSVAILVVPTGCFSPAAQSYAAAGGLGSFLVTVANCGTTTPAATTPDSWITLLPGPFVCARPTATSSCPPPPTSGSVQFAVAKNQTSSARTGQILVAGQAFIIDQAGVSSICTFTVSPASQVAPAAGGPLTPIRVVASSNSCPWDASVNAGSALHVTSGQSGIGNGIVNLSASTNSGATRTLTATIAGQTVSVQQNGSGLVCGAADISSSVAITESFTSGWPGFLGFGEDAETISIRNNTGSTLQNVFLVLHNIPHYPFPASSNPDYSLIVPIPQYTACFRTPPEQMVSLGNIAGGQMIIENLSFRFANNYYGHGMNSWTLLSGSPNK